MTNLPQIELVMHAPMPPWLSEEMLNSFRSALSALLPALLASPRGPQHVLSTLQNIDIELVDDPTIADVHARFLQDPCATDVITFPYGEIIVSCDTAERYAGEKGLNPVCELFRYIVHGLTHLHGYTDATEEERAVLFAMQEPLVEQFFPHHRTDIRSDGTAPNLSTQSQ